MNALPIRLRLTLAFAVVMAVVLTLLGAFLYVRLQQSLDERIADDLESRSAALAAALRAGDEVGALDPGLLRSDEGVVQVIGADGASLFPSDDPVLTAAELERARRGRLRMEREGLRVRAEPVDDSVVVVGESLEDRDEALTALLTQLLIALPLALLVASFIGYLVAGAALRPVESMRRRAAGITSDSPERRLPLPRAHDEIHRLGETLNEMLERLDAGLARERRFVADASHELRTPLSLLQTELELALRRPRSRDEQQRALRSAAEEVDRLVRLAGDLLVLARADDGKLPLSLDRHVVREVFDAVAGRFDSRARAAGRSLEVDASPEWVISGDRLRIEQALGNLVDNALRHGAGTIRLEAKLEGDWLEVAVSDEGAGFPAAFLPHAFERFSRAEVARSSGGAGLGLAIAEAVARAHGGGATAANTAAGPVITLRLPAHTTR